MALSSGLYLTGYFLVLGVLCVYGLHRSLLTWIYRRHREEVPPRPQPFEALPFVTIQLPLFNEPLVVERLLRATCAIDYPRERFEVQILDDSTDETSRIVAGLLPELSESGVALRHLRRRERRGFKAGALAEGLRVARGEFLLVFDADFVPPPDILYQMIHYFTDERIGMVQARWGHLNRGESLLTRIEAILLDGHFVVEHTARNRSGRFFNFNGTAGIWRRACIESAGGWHFDTLTEDLDLSYRAQLVGWRFLYLPEIVVPAELPPTLDAFFSQQFRWTKGAVQTARKILPAVFASPLPMRVKSEAFLHLTAHVGYPLLLLLAVMIVPATLIRAELRSPGIMALDLLVLSTTTVSIALFYLAAEAKSGMSRWRTLLAIPFLMAFGVGMSVNNTRALIEGLFADRGAFERTPKFGSEGAWRLRRRAFRKKRSLHVELAMALYLLGGGIVMAAWGAWFSLPFLLLFFSGFLLVIAHSLSLPENLLPAIVATLRRRRYGKT